MSGGPDRAALAERQIARLIAELEREPGQRRPVDLLEKAQISSLQAVLHLLRSSQYPLPAGRRTELLRQARDASRQSAVTIGCLLSETAASSR